MGGGGGGGGVGGGGYLSTKIHLNGGSECLIAIWRGGQAASLCNTRWP